MLNFFREFKFCFIRNEYSKLIISIYFPLFITKVGKYINYNSESLVFGKRLLVGRIRFDWVERGISLRFDYCWKSLWERVLFRFDLLEVEEKIPLKQGLKLLYC